MMPIPGPGGAACFPTGAQTHRQVVIALNLRNTRIAGKNLCEISKAKKRVHLLLSSCWLIEAKRRKAKPIFPLSSESAHALNHVHPTGVDAVATHPSQVFFSFRDVASNYKPVFSLPFGQHAFTPRARQRQFACSRNGSTDHVPPGRCLLWNLILPSETKRCGRLLRAILINT